MDRRATTDVGLGSSRIQRVFNSSTLGGDAAFMMNIGVVLDRDVSGETDCDDRLCWGSGNKYVARSNIRVRNGTDTPIRMRIYDPDGGPQDHCLELTISPKGKKAIPINILQNNALQFALYCGITHSWLERKHISDIVCAEAGRVLTGLYVLYIKSSLLSDADSRRQLMDHIIEVTGGFKFVNALPYSVEMKYFVARSDETFGAGEVALREQRTVLRAGQEVVLPLSLRSPEASAIKVRIVSSHGGAKPRRNYPSGAPMNRLRPGLRRNSFNGLVSSPESVLSRELEKWSDEVSLGDVMKDNAANTVEDVVIIPAYYTNAAVEVKVLKIRDPRRENLQYESEAHASCMVILYADMWIQNNSGIPLAYKVRTTSGDSRVVSDKESGQYDLGESVNQLLVGGVGQLLPPKNGPTIGPLDAKYMRVSKIDASKDGETRQNITSLQKFGNVTVQPPVSFGRSKSRMKIFLSSSVPAEVRCGNVWLGVSVKRAPGLFSRTYIVVLTPRYIIQNLTSFNILVFPVRVLRASTISSLLSTKDGKKSGK